jgi:hypothetical protein
VHSELSVLKYLTVELLHVVLRVDIHVLGFSFIIRNLLLVLCSLTSIVGMLEMSDFSTDRENGRVLRSTTDLSLFKDVNKMALYIFLVA